MSKTKKMNRVVKKKWVEALRSGKFEQGQGALCKNGKYCCLGVLSELALREGKTDKWVGEHGTIFYGKRRGSWSSGFTPATVTRWAGLPDDDPLVYLDKDGRVDLAALNDGGHTFAEIADLIDAQL